MRLNVLILVLLNFVFGLSACSPVKVPLANQYKLESFSTKHFDSVNGRHSILITVPEAAAGYQSSDMVYVTRPFELSSFANNGWVDQPANMLLPLIVQSLQCSGHFFAVTSSANLVLTDYRLDTQLIELDQNFLKKPSQVDLVIKVVLTHVSDQRVVGSCLITEHITAPEDTPYGGVIAANRATALATARISDFVISAMREDGSKDSKTNTLASK